MYLADIFATIRHSLASTLLLAIQVALTFAVLANVYAMVDAYTSQMISNSGYADEPTLLGITLQPYATPKRDAEARGQSRNQIERDLAVIRSTPGVKMVTLAQNGVPFMSSMGPGNFDSIRRPDQDPTSVVPNTRYSAVVNTLPLLGVDITAGRNFTSGDVRWVDSVAKDGGPAVIITQKLADILFPDRNPIGQQVVIESGRKLNVIGVVKRAKAVYWAPYDDYASFVAGRSNFTEDYLVRLDRSQMTGDFDKARTNIIQTLNNELTAAPIDREVMVQTLAEIKKANLGRYITINSIVGGVALLLIFVTFIGTYGQMSYTILKRTKQIGIRRALGATREYIFAYFMAENALVTLFGILPGLLLTLVLNTAILTAFGYGKLSWEHVVTCALFVFLVSFVAVLVPIYRATRVSPAIATQTV